MRELMGWCARHCGGRYAVMTAEAENPEEPGQRLCIQFETRDDADRFAKRFG